MADEYARLIADDIAEAIATSIDGHFDDARGIFFSAGEDGERIAVLITDENDQRRRVFNVTVVEASE